MGSLGDRPRSTAPSDFPRRDAATSSSHPTPGDQATASPVGQETNRIVTPKTEYEGESSISAQAALANRLLQDAVGSKPLLEVRGGMAFTLALDALSHTVQNQEHHDAEDVYPHARRLDAGCRLRDLPMPQVESALSCLRIAQGMYRNAGRPERSTDKGYRESSCKGSLVLRALFHHEFQGILPESVFSW